MAVYGITVTKGTSHSKSYGGGVGKDKKSYARVKCAKQTFMHSEWPRKKMMP